MITEKYVKIFGAGDDVAVEFGIDERDIKAYEFDPLDSNVIVITDSRGSTHRLRKTESLLSLLKMIFQPVWLKSN